jgi:hypothetical protein
MEWSDVLTAWGEELASALEQCGIDGVTPQDGFEVLTIARLEAFVQNYGFTQVAGVHRQALSDAIERVVERSVPESSVATALERTAARWPNVTFVIRLKPGDLPNPDADLRYVIPDLLQTRSAGRVQDNGFDYEDGDVMAIFVSTFDSEWAEPFIRQTLDTEVIYDNELADRYTLSVADNDHA